MHTTRRKYVIRVGARTVVGRAARSVYESRRRGGGSRVRDGITVIGGGAKNPRKYFDNVSLLLLLLLLLFEWQQQPDESLKLYIKNSRRSSQKALF